MLDPVRYERHVGRAGAQAAHVVEILDAITLSVAEGRAVEITSSFVWPMLGSNGIGYRRRIARFAAAINHERYRRVAANRYLWILALAHLQRQVAGL